MVMDATNTNSALCSALCEELARSGMRQAVICPGSRSTPLALALERNPSIDCEVVLDERSAGFRALGTAMTTSQPVAVLTTSGSAAANLHPAVVEADEASVPLICLTADRPPELRDIGAGQTIDQIKIFGSAVRWFAEVGTHRADDTGLLHLRSLGCRAYAEAKGDPRPGPVHLNIALREPLGPEPESGAVTATNGLALEGRGAAPLTQLLSGPTELDPELMEEIASKVAAARRPVIVAGLNRDGERLAEAASRLAEEADMPVLAEPTSQLRWGDHDRTRIISSYDLIARSAPSHLTPDLVVRIGHMPTSKALRVWLASTPDLTQIVIEPRADWKEPTRTAELIVRADPLPLLDELAGRLALLPERSDWFDGWKDADRSIRERIHATLDEDSTPTEPGLWVALSQVLADSDRVVCASSMPIRDLETFMPAGRSNVRFFSNRGANGIDGQISTAIGAAKTALGRTFAVLGDLAFSHDQGALADVAESPGLKLIVIDNRGGGIFDFLPIADLIEPSEMEKLFTTPSGSDLVALAEAHGLEVSSPDSTGALEAALADSSQVVVLNTQRDSNLELHRRLSREAEALLGERSGD